MATSISPPMSEPVFTDTEETSAVTLKPWRIAGIYAVVAILWIYFSDRILLALVTDPERLLAWSVYKGIGFVAVTTLLLLVLIRTGFRQIHRGYVALAARDRERAVHMSEIERLTRLYSALSQVAQAIPRTRERDDLFETVCRTMVEFGGLRMAWIDWKDPDSDKLVRVAHAGKSGRDLLSRGGGGDGEPEPDSPGRTALRTGAPSIHNHLGDGAADASWRSEAARGGYRSCASFPIWIDERLEGVLTVYAGESGFFQSQEVALLASASADLAAALERLDREQARGAAQAAAESERIFSESLIECMPGILYLFTAEGRFLRWNQNFEIVSGFSAEELADIQPLQFFASDDQVELAHRIGEVFESGESFVEAPFVSRDGTSTPYLLTGRRVRFEGQECLVGIGIDVSKRHAAETALRELNQTLEQRVSDRTAELQAALVRAESADRLKSAFLATMSHELRTPLNSIIGFTGIVLQGLAGPLTEEQAKQLGMVRVSANHLLDLINDVLDLSKIEAGQLQVRREPFDLAKSIERVAGTVRPLANAKGLELEVWVGDGVNEMIGDRRRVEQVLLNLLNNGIKFTDAGRVGLRAEREGDRVVLQVTDTGIGIREEGLELLFRPFSQVDTGLARQHEGTGLGLAICRRLVTLMEGEITVSSEWQQGSVFRVTLPTAPTG